MSSELEIAARYRLHAEELRNVADAAVDTNLQRQFRALASDYTRMADQLEQIDKTNTATERSR